MPDESLVHPHAMAQMKDFYTAHQLPWAKLCPLLPADLPGAHWQPSVARSGGPDHNRAHMKEESMSNLSLDQANLLINGALAKAAALKLKPLCVVVIDAGSNIVAIQRQDGASALRWKVALGKAAGALGIGVSSRKIAEMALERPAFVASLGSIATQGVVPAAGGLIVKDAKGAIHGAVGVSGDTSDNDELCALAGAAAAGLVAQP